MRENLIEEKIKNLTHELKKKEKRLWKSMVTKNVINSCQKTSENIRNNNHNESTEKARHISVQKKISSIHVTKHPIFLNVTMFAS